MQIVGDLHAELHREGLALPRAMFPRARCRRPRLPARARSDDFRAAISRLRFGFAEAHAGARVAARHEAAAVNGDFAAGNGGAGLDAVDARYGRWFSKMSCDDL